MCKLPLKYLSCLDAMKQLDNDNLDIPRYNVVHSDHPSNNKCGGVTIYYKTLLPLRIINISFFHKCIIFEVMTEYKPCNFIGLYWSLS